MRKVSVKNYIYLLLSSILSVITFNSYIYDPLTHMTTANILPGIAPHIELGYPYTDYWDVYPPGIYLIYFIIYIIFNDTFTGYIVIHFLLLITTIFCAYTILNFQHKNNVLFYIGLLYFLSPLYIDYLMVNDLIAVCFSYLGLVFFIRFKNKNKYLFSNYFLFFAVFIKETFFFASFSIVIYQILIKDFKNLKYSIFGFFSTFLTIFTYTSLQSITNSVIKSYVNKFYLFDVKNMVFKLLISIVVLILLILIFKFYLSSKVQFIINNKNLPIYIYSIILLISFLIIGKDDGGHFDIPKVFTTFFLLTSLLKLKQKMFYLIIIFLISGFYLKANHSLTSYKTINLQIHNDFPSKDNLIDTELQNLLKNNNEELLFLYGWGSSNFFYNYELKPYSKYWIVHPQILTEDQILSLKYLIKKNPPNLIYYCGFEEYCPAGFDYLEFEDKYINFNFLISNCYTNIYKKLFELNSLSCVKDLNF